MTARRKRTPEGDEWTFTVSKTKTTLLAVGLLLLVSGHPGAQKVLSMAGMQTPVADIEAIRADTQDAKKQIAQLVAKESNLEQKVDALLIEFQRYQMRQRDTASIELREEK